MKKLPTTPFMKLVDRIDGDVTWQPLDRVMLATDASIFSREPAAVVYPRHTGMWSRPLILPGSTVYPFTPGGRAAACAGRRWAAGIVVDFTRHMNRLIDIDPASRTFTCEPGYRLGELARALKGRGLFFPPDPSSGEYASFGGMVGDQRLGRPFGQIRQRLRLPDWMPQVVLSTGRVITFSAVGRQVPDRLPENLAALAALYRENRDAIEIRLSGGALQRGRIQPAWAGQRKTGCTCINFWPEPKAPWALPPG
jgi:hypothetical protein